MKHPIILGSVLVLLAAACRPPISVRQQPEIANVSCETEVRGDDVFVSVKVASKEGDSSWKVEFVNDDPEQLTLDKVVSTTNIRWKVNADRSKLLTQYRISPITTSSPAPYQLKLTSRDGQATHLTVSFIREARGFGIASVLLVNGI
ncbi:MAG: hypothetical protein HY014_17445 [Acidobacteria bacterium]|nr:hypothetical protein [Acidobacteriota bacterium]MBI3489920.1 hypothetical protein [Acidobacteriota bacterium]